MTGKSEKQISYAEDRKAAAASFISGKIDGANRVIARFERKGMDSGEKKEHLRLWNAALALLEGLEDAGKLLDIVGAPMSRLTSCCEEIVATCHERGCGVEDAIRELDYSGCKNSEIYGMLLNELAKQ